MSIISQPSRVNILPCSGIGKALGTVSRWSAFEIVGNIRPNNTSLLCLARLVAGDEESQAQIKQNYNITLDGCPKRCALKNLEHHGGKVDKSYMMAKFLVKNRDLPIGPKNVTDPEENIQKLAKRIGEEVSKVVDSLILRGSDSQ